jgi:hypothetical protein
MKSMKHKNKYFESDQEGYIRIYPSIHETKVIGVFYVYYEYKP